MKLLISAYLLLFTVSVNAQSLYSRAFGQSEKPAIIFLHGGPGYNCANFEATTAQQLADSGFYVIVYDRRGEGRSSDSAVQYSFDQTTSDLNLIYKQYNISKATLMGHSFGGIVAVNFASEHPKNVTSIVLLSAPISFQSTLTSILNKSKNIYLQNNDGTNLRYISMLEKMDSASLEYSSYCFMHAMQNGFYTPATPSPHALSIYSTFQTDTLLTKYANLMTYEAPKGFWNNERYTTIDLTESIRSIQNQHVHIYGVYGKDDGLFSESNVTTIQSLLGADYVQYLENCSHNVFIDQQNVFISSVIGWIK